MDIERCIMNELMEISTSAINTIPDCNEDTCPIRNECRFKKIGKCGVQSVYVNQVANAISTMYKGCDDSEKFRIAVHLLPLYVQLGRLQMTEIGVNSTCYSDNKGNIKIHPVFREIRDTLRTIAVMWRELAMFEPPLGTVKQIVEGEVIEGDMEKGNPNYYATISKERANVKRLR